MITYLIETNDIYPEVEQYCDSYQEARSELQKYAPNKFRILSVEGQYFGEGFHKYHMIWDGNKFKRKAV